MGKPGILINGQKVLAIITARGGSKGVPKKNIRHLGGKPLIAWTIEVAQKSKYIDRLILSSDDQEIIQVAQRYGCEVPFVREAGLATDTATSIDVVIDALERCPGFDWVILLQPTSPLRTTEDIDAAMETCLSFGADSCVSVTEVEESPFWMYRIENSRLTPILEPSSASRRQDLPEIYSLNGAVYISQVKSLLERKSFLRSDSVSYIMPKNRSVDIDNEIDFDFLEYLIREKK
ncbi:cytidylyltransferase domain-containing protein [Leptospira adleri]|uniref:Acylneuraminate cytidylyltransferase n=1 Tax=Leptospira adleri TaxID=2023186 RepID=A0A2M9YPB4_9LEPT|nr:acylneuraminate cytidylyltransferase family protein [Leptospira adleri]PJZ53384.1 acylneuraminate cytidylyltransferase [Leptospira adleri]PJZ61827.1 acylneuraminate cytidylyltransferase [Leptospira adleri]